MDHNLILKKFIIKKIYLLMKVLLFLIK